MTDKKESLAAYWKKSGLVSDEKLIKAFLDIPREAFVSSYYVEEAYGDYPLPIGHEQTISQPTTVMLMIQALQPGQNDKVLEVGAGSGYGAAILSKLCKKVITTEIVPGLCEYARKNIQKLGITNVEVISHDGSRGYEKEAPYDKIIATAACPRIPEPWTRQLTENGIVIAPVGPSFGQKMIKGIKKGDKLATKNLGDFMFVPLKGEFGF